VSDHVTDLKFKAIETTLSHINTTLGEIRTDIREIRSDISAIRADVATLRDRVSKLEGLVANIPSTWVMIGTTVGSQLSLTALIFVVLRYAH
jgi:septal ring factor EnvC (AmiA/AmiB activator)